MQTSCMFFFEWVNQLFFKKTWMILLVVCILCGEVYLSTKCCIYWILQYYISRAITFFLVSQLPWNFQNLFTVVCTFRFVNIIIVHLLQREFYYFKFQKFRFHQLTFWIKWVTWHFHYFRILRNKIFWNINTNKKRGKIWVNLA